MSNRYSFSRTQRLRYFWLLFVAFLFSTSAGAQVSAYTFSQSTGTYTPITGATVLNPAGGSRVFDDTGFNNLPIGFTFNYNGAPFTVFSVNPNGSITLGATVVAGSAVLSATGGNSIAAMNRDLSSGYVVGGTRLNASPLVSSILNTTGASVGMRFSGTGFPTTATISSITANSLTLSANSTAAAATPAVHAFNFGGTAIENPSEISYVTTGSVGSRVLTVQFTGVKRFGTTLATVDGDRFNFQIQLFETTNVVSIVYGPCVTAATTTTANTFGVGLRGSATSDFNVRTTTTNWAATTAGTLNTATCALTPTIIPASGLTFTWTPPSCAAPGGLANTSATLTTLGFTWNAALPTPSVGYEWELRTSGAAGSGATGLVASGSGNTLTTNFTGLTANTTYTMFVRSDCGSSVFSAWSNGVTGFTGYCQVSVTTTGDNISSFNTTGGITNITNSSSGTGAYEDFTLLGASGFGGQVINFTSTYVGGSAGLSIWIDWNNDLVFDNATERVFNLATLTATPAGSFTVPALQALGSYRMRVRAQWNTLNPPACGNIGFGQAEDYTFTVVTPPTCFAPTALSGTATSTSAANLAWTAPTSGTPVNYEWEVRSSGLGGSGAIGLAASGTVAAPVVSASASGLTQYVNYTLWVRTDCGSGDFSAWASSATFQTQRGDNCAGAVDLALFTSPISSSTVGLNNDFTSAQSTAATGGGAGPDDIFFFDVPACATLTIQMTASSYDNATALRRGGSCPGTIQISSFDANLATHTYVNTASVPERVWYIIDGWSTGSGTYTFNWAISTSCQAPQALTATPVGTGANASWSSCTSAVGYEWQLQTPVGAQGANVVQSGNGTTPTTLALSGLVSLTPYRLWVRNDCGSGNFSSWVSVDFTSFCNGTPTAGTITPSSASVCLNGPTQLFTSAGQSTGAGLVYQWQQSPDGSTNWTNIPGATAANLTIQATALQRFYRQVVTCQGSGLTATSNVVELIGTTGGACAASFGVARNASASYTPLFPSGTSFTWQGSPTNGDDVSSTTTNIGFTFNYFGINYTNFRVSTNGFLSLGATLTGTNFTNNLNSNSSTLNAIIAPLWDDLIVPGNSTANLNFVSYTLSGDPGSRILTVEWAGMERFGYPGPNMNFQARLYEGTNQIEFVYGSMTMTNGTQNALYTYSLGLNSHLTTLTPANILSQQQFNTNIFGGLAQNSLTVVPECNTSYLFTPGGSIGVGSPLPAITNDEPASAISLTLGTSSPAEYCGWNRSAGATASAGVTACSAATPGNADDDVWFTFNNPSAQNIRVSVVPEGGYNAVVQVFSDASATTSLACSNAVGAGLTENVDFTTLAPGNYWVRVYDAAAGATAGGHFHVSAFIPPPIPTNDNPQNAIVLAAGGICNPISGVSLGATPGDAAGTPPTAPSHVPAAGTAGVDDDVWYRFTATSTSTQIQVQSGSGYNAAFQLYDGGVAPGAFTAAIPAVGAQINSTSTLGLESNTYSSLVVGNVYFVRVYHVASGSGPTGAFTICRRDVCPQTITAFSAIGNTPTLQANFTWTGNNADLYYGAVPITAPNDNTAPTQSNVASGVTVSGLTINTTYNVWHRSNCGDGTFGSWVGPVTYFTGYCPPTGGTFYGLTNVVTSGGLTNISNATGIGAPGYTNYTATLGASNYEGLPTTITLTTNTGTHTYYCWIDWNNDFDFDDANETIFATTTFTNGHTGTINIPAGTPVGNYRMRVANSFSGTITPCGPAPNGEYEDYRFTVAPPVTCVDESGTGTISGPSTICAGVPFELTSSISTIGTEYTWQRRTGATWVTIPGATTRTITVTQTVATDYRVRIGCALDNTTATSPSSVVAVAMNPFNQCYCTPTTGTNSTTDMLHTFTLGSINNVSAVNPSVYTSYPASAFTTTLSAGGEFSGSFRVGTFSTNNVGIWLDLNRNGQFESSERLYVNAANIPGGPSPFPLTNFTITVPTNAQLGTTTLRVRRNDVSGGAGVIDPCLPYSFQETEDYIVTIVAGAANDVRANAQPVTPAVFPGCSNITANLANATPSQGTPGNDLWYRFTATSNAVRIQLTGAQDCAIELEDAAGTTLELEDATTASGNEVLAVGNLTIGTQYWVAVRSQNATPANFTCCIQALNDSRCDNGSSFASLCSIFKVDWTGTPSYVARFTETAAPFATFTANLPTSTSILLRNIPGLQHNRSYNVSVDAIYTITDAGGNTSTIVATSNETCPVTISQHPLVNMRSLDRDPATRAIGAFIGTDVNVCSVTNWEWTFELVDNAGVPTSLDGPISVLANTTSRFIRTSQIPNVAPGNRYRVRVRPIFASGPGVFDDASSFFLRIASSAGMVDVFDNTATPEQVYFERNTENGVFAALYPNPNNGDMVNLNLAGIDSDNVNVRIMDASGRIVWTNRFVVDGALNTIIAFDRPLTSGIYLVEMTYDNEVITERMMVTK